MLNRIINVFGKKGTYVALKPEILKELVLKARNNFDGYVQLAKFLGCSDTYLCRYKRSKPVAISMDKLLHLMEITNSTLLGKNIEYIQRGRSGYVIPSQFIFTDNPWYSLNAWNHYILGAIAADGSIHKGNLYFKISPRDVEFSAAYIYNLTKFAEKIHQQDVHLYVGVDKGKRLGGSTNSVTLSSRTFIIFLQKIINLSLKTNYNVPSWFAINPKFTFPWLAGITDGDGYIWKKTDKYGTYWFWDISNGRIEPLERIKSSLEHLIGQINIKLKFEGGGKYSFRIQNMKILSAFFPELLHYMVIERKRERMIKALDYFTERGIDIKIPEKQRNTRNPIMDKAVDFLKERDMLTKLQNWEKLETYGEAL